MERLSLKDLNSIVEHLENSRNITKDIIENQSGTLFHSKDYYEGQLDTYNNILRSLKIHLEITKNVPEQVIREKLEQEKSVRIISTR